MDGGEQVISMKRWMAVILAEAKGFYLYSGVAVSALVLFPLGMLVWTENNKSVERISGQETRPWEELSWEKGAEEKRD